LDFTKQIPNHANRHFAFVAPHRCSCGILSCFPLWRNTFTVRRSVRRDGPRPVFLPMR
jgi:hypothetical protein